MKNLIWEDVNGFGDCYYISLFEGYEDCYEVQINYTDGDYSIIINKNDECLVEEDICYTLIEYVIKGVLMGDKLYNINLPTQKMFKLL